MKDPIANAEKFRQFVDHIGVRQLADKLTALGPRQAVTPQAIYQWMEGSSEPKASKIRAIVQIANGAITYQHAHDYIELATEAYAASRPTPKGTKRK
jgi:hypothetical protein